MKAGEANAQPSPFRETRRDRHISIEGMKGPACVEKVKRALGEIKGIDVESVKVGHATIRSATIPEARGACAAIVRAGFGPRKAPRPA